MHDDNYIGSENNRAGVFCPLKKGIPMRKIFCLASCALLIVLSFGCNDSSSGAKFSGSQWSESLSPNMAALERAIVADILGGIASDSIDPASMTLSGLSDFVVDEIVGEEEVAEEETEASEEESEETTKLSINAPLERGYSQSNDSFEYEGPNGGSLFITASGMIEEIDMGQTDNNALVRFFPMQVHFTFENYDYTNSCGVRAVVNGTLSCKLTGSFFRESEILDANGNCATGGEGMGGSILYSLNQQESHDLNVHTTVKVNGPWYELTSYNLIGNYVLDKRSGNIDMVLTKAPALCTAEY